MLQKFRGIVLRAIDYGESNQIVRVFSDRYGKFSFMAQGSKKPKSRFRAVTEPFTEGEFICFVGSGLANLSQGDIINAHQSLSTDLMKSIYGSYWFELIDRLLAENEPNSAFYRFLSQMLSLLEKDQNHEILTRIFELRIMNVTGYRPVLHQCVICRSKNSPYRLSVIHGGFLCENCWKTDPNAIRLSSAVERILPLLQQIQVERLRRIQVKEQTERQLREIVYALMDEHIGIEFKARGMIEQLRD